jgi:hypothetical protein
MTTDILDADEPTSMTRPTLDDSTIKSPDDAAEISRRLVEYFVMVSSVPVTTEDGRAKIVKKKRQRGPPDPNRDKMNSRTKARFDVRRAHLSNVAAAEEHIPTIKESEGKDETASTTSTSSTVDGDQEVAAADEGGVDTLKPSNCLEIHLADGLHELKDETVPTAIPQDKSGPGSKSIDDNTEDYLLEPVITARYPANDHEDQPLNPRLPQFCHPEGTDFIHPTKEYKMPRIHFFVLTDNMGGKQYGTCLTVYEQFHGEGEQEHILCASCPLPPLYVSISHSLSNLPHSTLSTCHHYQCHDRADRTIRSKHLL